MWKFVFIDGFLTNSIRSSLNRRDFFCRLLLRLPPLRALEPSVVEELFFAGLIGQVQIDSVVPYILRMSNGMPTQSNKVKSEHLDEFICK